MGAAGVLILPSAVAASPGHRPADGAPRSDFLELSRAVGGTVLMPESRAGLTGAIERQVRRLGYWDLAWQARRAGPPVILSLSEKIGMCVALTDPGTPHAVVAHNLTTPRRRAFQRVTRWLSRPERIVVLSRPQQAYLCGEVGLPEARVTLLHHHVDDRFFRPQGAPEQGYVLSVGQTGRDFTTLMEAVRVRGVPTVVVASSRWISAAASPDLVVPPNVTLRQGVSDGELRALYDGASLVVVPLHPGLRWAAGVTGVLEGMAMGKPVVVSRTPGLEDYLTDGVDGLWVPAGDPCALGSTVEALLEDPDRAHRLGRAARRRVEAECTLDGYVAALARLVGELGG